MNIEEYFACLRPIEKLYEYGYLPAKTIYSLATKKRDVFDPLIAYSEATNALLVKYGVSDNGVNYEIMPENTSQYISELNELNQQNVDVGFLKGIVLDVQDISKIDSELPAHKRLGYSANDWYLIRNILDVVEKEE